MRLAIQAKRSLIGLGFVVFTLGILWTVNSGATPSKEHIAQDNVVPPVIPQATQPQESIWSQLIPKTSVEKRDASRVQRQRELATMIQALHGIANASVILSDDAGQMIGQAHRPMTACITVDPTSGTIPKATIQAICKLIAGATMGLQADQVTVINNRTGTVCSMNQLGQSEPFNPTVTRREIEDALGLIVATVTVSMEKLEEGIFHIPWRGNARPLIHVSVPQSWVSRRAAQVGGQSIVLSSIQSIVQTIVPGSQINLSVIQDTPTVTPIVTKNESYANQVVLLAGLLTILLSGFMTDRHRRPHESVVVLRDVTPRHEATRILAMNHEVARQAIDTLHGVNKIEVLNAIVALDVPTNDPPVVKVPQQRQLELTRCG